MWRRFSGSLTLRIFLITTALLMAACALTYGAIAYLTPISYTTLLEDELQRETGALMAQLEAATAEDGETILWNFTRRTGADAMLLDVNESEAVLSSVEDDAIIGDAADEASISVVEDIVFGTTYVAPTAKDSSAHMIVDAVEGTADDRSYMQVTIVEDALQFAGGRYDVTFRDGQRAELVVRGGLRAVNRTTEAMRRVLPYLALALLAFSLAGSFFYARFITRPIVDMSAIAARIANLDFHARWTRRRRDEIGALGESLNRLSDNLSGALGGLREANEALKRDMARERELERQRLAFFSASSHELKTPVTILKGQLSGMLAQVGAYRDREKYLARALEVVGRMEGLVRQILTISRVESGEIGIGAERVDLSALLCRQLEQDEELFAQRGLRLVREIAPDVTVRGNESLLASALDNVLMNAILYSPRGAAVQVRLTAERLCVVNGGAVIDEADLAHLFEPFYRVEQSRNRKSGGSGLGLYLVQSILRLHGMNCAMENTSEGVRFTAVLRDGIPI